jgi:hypothetical protein
METTYLGGAIVKIYPKKIKPESRVNLQDTNKCIE